MGSFIYSNEKLYLQFVGNNETAFNLGLDSQRKDSKAKNTILACRHFQTSNHDFQRDKYRKNNETSYNRPVTTYSKWIILLHNQAKNTSSRRS